MVLYLFSVYESAWVALALATFMRFCVSITFYVVNLQAMEIYPTCLRQTGISTSIIASNAVGVLGPYIILLVTINSINNVEYLNNFI